MSRPIPARLRGQHYAAEEVRTGDGGQCFPHAWDVLTHCPPSLRGRPVTKRRLVHGTPIGTGPLNGGLRYWHAWVEVQVRGIGWLVLDGSKDPHAPTGMTRESYYRLGKISSEHVWRYSPSEALAEGRATGHSGPWITDEESGVEI